jgi:hypothetical protein
VRKYGEVEFAAPVNHKYPVDTPEHIHAAWRYIHQEDVELIKRNIERAAKKHSIELPED